MMNNQQTQVSCGRGRARSRIVSVNSTPTITASLASPPSNNTVYGVGGSGASCSDEKSKFEPSHSSMSTSVSFSSNSSNGGPSSLMSNSSSCTNFKQGRQLNYRRKPSFNQFEDYEDAPLCEVCDRPNANIICKSCGCIWTGVIRKQCPVHTKTLLLMGHQECGSCGSNDLKEVPI